MEISENKSAASRGIWRRRKMMRPIAVAATTMTVMATMLTACGSAAATASTSGTASTSSAASATSAPLKIGFIVPETGSVAADGIPMKNGFDLALKQINNKGGVLGNKIQVITLDDQSNPALAAQDALKLIRQDHVNFLAGTISGAEVAAVAHVATAAKVPFSQFIMGSISYCSPYFWPFGETNATLVRPLIPTLLKKWGNKVALVGSDYNFPHDYNALAKKLILQGGGSVVAEEYAPLGTSNWAPVISKLQAAKPDWILSAVVGGDAIAFAKQANQLGLLNNSKLTGVSFIQEYYPAISQIADGALLVSRYSEQLPGSANATFVSSYQAAYGNSGPIAGVAANAYEGLGFIVKAVQEAGSTNPQKVVAQLQHLNVNGIFGSGLHFNSYRHFMTPMHLVKIEAGGKYVPLATYTNIKDQACGVNQ